ncbi:MAG: hypothetical protein US74_C0003G0004 [Parcubacteria group bacterium GW2011_GWA2_38_13]|nr:MAG: hypothetical protein US74_C0003G0004 [Parcubacteria group bacterium GW2011_GWA2_38_13]
MKLFIVKIAQYIFESLCIALFLLFGMEFMKTGVVTNYINFNLLLTLTLIFGIIVVLLNNGSEEKNSKFKIMNTVWRVIFSVAIGMVCVIIAGQALMDQSNFGAIARVAYIMPWVMGFGAGLSVYAIIHKK